MIDSLMRAAPDTPEGDWLDVLVTLVETYEARRWPVEAPYPVAMIKHAMEARGNRQKDLTAVIRSQPHASEVLSRRRTLTLLMIRALSAKRKIPADVLLPGDRSAKPWNFQAGSAGRRPGSRVPATGAVHHLRSSEPSRLGRTVSVPEYALDAKKFLVVLSECCQADLRQSLEERENL